MKFHPRHYSLFLSPFFPHCIKSRDHFAAILSLSLTHLPPFPPRPLRPFSSMSVSLSFFSDSRIFMYTRRAFWIKRSWQSHKEARHIVSETDRNSMRNNVPSFYLEVYAWNAVALQAEKYIPMPIVCISQTSSRAIHIMTWDIAFCFYKMFMYV